jgi:hypothetical protein
MMMMLLNMTFLKWLIFRKFIGFGLICLLAFVFSPLAILRWCLWRRLLIMLMSQVFLDSTIYL